MVGATEQFQILEEMLRWYAEAGVDSCLDDEPHDRFAEAEQELLAAKQAATAPKLLPQSTAQLRSVEQPRMAALVTSSPDEAAILAKAQANTAKTLLELRTIMNSFSGCALKATATQLVFGDGDEAAKIMFVGEVPGREEDATGVPFVGPPGLLLNKMLNAIGLKRSDVYVSQIVPWRPPGNRTATLQEMAICKPFITRQIELVNPEILVCLGGPASQTLLNQTLGILNIRGHWIDYKCGERTIKAMPILHPAYLLRQPLQKKLAWKDLQEIRESLQTFKNTD
jgi:uracil-DNA glycosylase